MTTLRAAWCWLVGHRPIVVLVETAPMGAGITAKVYELCCGRCGTGQ